MTSASKFSTRRAARLSAAILTAALALSACGGDDETSGAAAPAKASGDPMLAYARCMREQGVDMPDPKPDANGRFLFKQRRSEDPQQLERANAACEGKMQGALPTTPGDQRQASEQGLRFARCMREHGIDMPDPTAQGAIRIRPGDGVDPADPAFQKAEQECASIRGGQTP